jgi:hypothetical protein
MPITPELSAIALDLTAWSNAFGVNALIEHLVEEASHGKCTDREAAAMVTCARNHLRGNSSHKLADRNLIAKQARELVGGKVPVPK